MTGYSNSPKVLKGGIVLIDAESARVLRIISLQYNPDSLSRSFQVQGAGGEGGNRSEALRFKGPAIETYKLEAEIDAADQLEFPDQHRAAVENGIQPQLAVLESLVYPTSSNCWTGIPWRNPACWKSRRWKRRCHCLYGARIASCRCGSRISALPRRPSTRI